MELPEAARWRDRFMATLHHDHTGNGFIYVKGAPERLLEMCQWERADGAERPIAAGFWQRKIDEIAAKGQRVLAIAVKRVDVARCELTHNDIESGLILLGLFGLIDPPRQEAIIAIRECHSAGIGVKMITGDHAMTATAIARDLELANPDRVLTGGELEQMTDEALRDAVLGVNVFARASPEHKLRLVQALQWHGQVVAMTGDGVNDAPALKRADIGIAMGLKGTEAAKEASEMVLADDNFASIEHAVREGRTVYDNLKKTILYLLPISGAQALTVIVAVMIGESMPILPVQILWVNLVDGVTLGLALAFERAEPGIMNRPPRSPKERLLSSYFVWRIAFVSFIALAATFGLFEWELARGSSIEAARTAAVNTLVASGVGYLFCVRLLSQSSASMEGLFGSRVVLMAVGLIIIFQAAFTYFPPMETFFGTRPLDISAWGRIAAVAVMLFIFVELEKAVVRNWQAASTAAPKRGLGWEAPAVAFALLAAVGGWFIWSLYPDSAARYETQRAERGSIVRAISTIGVIKPGGSTSFGASASGVIQDVLCDVGVKVKAGQVCATIDPRPLQAAVDREEAALELANSRLARSKADADKAKANFERDQIRVRNRAISRAVLDRSSKVYERAQAQMARHEALVATREAALRTAKISLDNADIVAPSDGMVVERKIERGRSVKADPKASLFLITPDPSTAQLDANVSEEDIGEVTVGDDVSFTVGSLRGRQFTGKVMGINSTPRTIDGVATHSVSVSAPDPDRLLEPGMEATVAILVGQHQDVLRIPVRALHFTPSGDIPNPEQPGDAVTSRVWVLRGKEPKAVSVRLGVNDGVYQEVVGDDLQPGDELIVGERGRDMTHKMQMEE